MSLLTNLNNKTIVRKCVVPTIQLLTLSLSLYFNNAIKNRKSALVLAGVGFCFLASAVKCYESRLLLFNAAVSWCLLVMSAAAGVHYCLPLFAIICCCLLLSAIVCYLPLSAIVGWCLRLSAFVCYLDVLGV
jgi:hypothetical protein